MTQHQGALGRLLKKLVSRTKQQPRAATAEPEPSGAPPSTQPPPHDDVVSDDLFPCWPPPSPRAILSRRAAYSDSLCRRRYRAPRGVFEDTPVFALYRLYEWIMAGHTVNMRNELEMFWWARWPVASIPDPDPDDPDPERRAVLACIPALLVESFNERVRLGLRRAEPHAILALDEQLAWAASPKVYETAPTWTQTVEPLATLLHIPHTQPGRHQLKSLDDDEASVAFKAKGILAVEPHIHFV